MISLIFWGELTRVEDGDSDACAGDPHLPEDVRLQHGRDLAGDGAQQAPALVPPGRVPPPAERQAAPALCDPEMGFVNWYQV